METIVGKSSFKSFELEKKDIFMLLGLKNDFKQINATKRPETDGNNHNRRSFKEVYRGGNNNPSTTVFLRLLCVSCVFLRKLN